MIRTRVAQFKGTLKLNSPQKSALIVDGQGCVEGIGKDIKAHGYKPAAADETTTPIGTDEGSSIHPFGAALKVKVFALEEEFLAHIIEKKSPPNDSAGSDN